MNQKEQKAFDRLKRENEYLKAKMSKHMDVYRELLSESVTHQMFVADVEEALNQLKLNKG